MGGGDLNLKKSWHPHTMKNQEKVWKAEQAKNAEDRKMNDLRREIMEEKNREDLIKIGQSSGVLTKNDDKKLEWMYKSSSELLNREDYLLGRPVDKAFEIMEAEEKSKDMAGMKVPINHVEHECIPFSIRSYRNATSTEQVDLQRKILEDPLMMIKQKEMESRRKILENPVKLKELHRILKIEKTKKSKSGESNSSTKKSKKSKKSKKKKHRSSDSEESDKDLDEMLEKQYKKLKDKDSKQLGGLDLTKLLDAKYETISKELDKAAQSKKKKSKKSSKNRRSSSSRSSNSGGDSDSDGGRERNRKSEQTRSYRDKSRSPLDQRDHRRDRERRPSPDRRNGRSDRDRHSPSERRNWNAPNRNRNFNSNRRTDDRYQRRSYSRSPQRKDQSTRRSRSPEKSKYSQQRSSTARNYNEDSKSKSNNNEDSKSKSAQKSRLTEEEKEQRLKDMMDNAAWRDKERTKYVQNYREVYKKEEEQNKARDFDKEFINTQLRKAISTQNSVESRIKSNVNNIQRTSAAMNANFVKK
ncbi:pre-mRNA-splicing factor CWC25 homolog [Eupeodes corollae]|uniref:pre-mRNA-splicing factor CWC25 homolog n=1 Tax=Eupeodes corollae TaxID=290404 RepID=UPI002492BD44|nr:pre-mRNA-splicing factor CWC25 homolog [Eupeodes corollae]